MYSYANKFIISIICELELSPLKSRDYLRDIHVKKDNNIKMDSKNFFEALNELK
jgi:hypothetical protein